MDFSDIDANQDSARSSKLLQTVEKKDVNYVNLLVDFDPNLGKNGHDTFKIKLINSELAKHKAYQQFFRKKNVAHLPQYSNKMLKEEGRVKVVLFIL